MHHALWTIAQGLWLQLLYNQIENLIHLLEKQCSRDGNTGKKIGVFCGREGEVKTIPWQVAISSFSSFYLFLAEI